MLLGHELAMQVSCLALLCCNIASHAKLRVILRFWCFTGGACGASVRAVRLRMLRMLYTAIHAIHSLCACAVRMTVVESR